MLFDGSNSFDANKAQTYLDKLIKSGSKFEIKKPKEVRTINQNSYLHVCIAMFCNETGYTREQALEFFSFKLPEILRYDFKGMNLIKSTTTLDTKEMTVLIDTIREFCSDQLGVYVPTSEDYLIHQFQIRKELEWVR